MSGPAMRELPGQDDPLYQTWIMLLNGYGYNWYRLDNQLHADDLLIRSQASGHLAAAASRLRDIEANYRRQYLTPPSREHPYPDADHVAAARRLHAIAERIVYRALDIVAEKAKDDPVKVWDRALSNVQPKVEVKSRRVGGATYQVPVDVRPDRAIALGMRWIISSNLSRSGGSMVRDAASMESTSIKIAVSLVCGFIPG